jgi:hypothetical protein
MAKRRYWLLVCLFVLSGRPTVAYSQTATVEVAALISRLGSTAYPERIAAQRDLAALGNSAREDLETALESPDPEVRLAASGLLKRLKLAELWGSSAVDGILEGEQLSSIFAAIAQQTGNRLLVSDQYGAFNDATASLDFQQVPFWRAVDVVCSQTGNHVRPHYDTGNPGLVVVAGAPGKNPVAYAGPVRAQVTSARRVFVEELDYQQMTSEQTHTFQLNLQVMWEDRFRLVAYRSQPDLVLAATDSGVPLSATQSAGSGWNIASTGTRQLSMTLRLNPPPIEARSLETLQLRWGLVAVGDMAVHEISDLSTPAVHRTDDMELVLEEVQIGNPRCELLVHIVRDMVVPDPSEILVQENQFELLDAEGRAYRAQGQTNSLTDRGARLRLSFLAPATDSSPAVLRCHYPRLRSQHDLEIVFNNVPLPTGHPE